MSASSVQMEASALPGVTWTGTAHFKALATFHDGHLSGVSVMIVQNLGDESLESAFAQDIEDAIRENYVCHGDHSFIQDFDYTVKP